MHRARFAEEAGAEFCEYAVGLPQHLPEPVRGVRIVGGMHLVIAKADRVRQFVRLVVDLDVDAEFAER